VLISDPVTGIKGVGEELAKKLGTLGIYTIDDLINNFPRRYVDYSTVVPIKKMRPGSVTIDAKIGQVSSRYVRRGFHITEAIASDAGGSVRLVWFNQPYRAAAIHSGRQYFISGDYGLRRNRFSILNPSMELASDFPVNTARIIPIYKETKGLKSYMIRRVIREAIKSLPELPDYLPGWLVKDQNLITYDKAVMEIHFPSGAAGLMKARKRLGFDEVFQLTLAALLNKQEFSSGKSLAVPFNVRLAKDFVSKLPFELTDAQRRVAWQIFQDMSKTQPMNRLVEGDVGAGKTVVAAMAALMVMEQGFQAALMAPTEILARQHAATLVRLLASVGYQDHIGLLLGSLKPSTKTALHQKISGGSLRLVVGTHALIAEKVDMHKLGLIIIDEQHRFGVEQRKKLQSKAGHMPHVLHLTATPIPRSLALTLYGELDVSILDEMPPGRRPVKTKLVSPVSKSKLYVQVGKEIAAGRQMFVVCPLISGSETSRGLAAEEVYKSLATKDFNGRRVGLLHGKMKTDEKEKIMAAFRDRKFDILVTTTVIEVGVDVPNATIMMVMGAERFGLAQIHQLRGRVGRSSHQSYCFLLTSDARTSTERLRALETTTDGFKLAELDLRLRGPGAIYGTLQHGALDLRIADLSDMRLIASARSAAQEFINKGEALDKYPHLMTKVTSLRAVTNLN